MSNPETALATVPPSAGMTLLAGYQAFRAGEQPDEYTMDEDEAASLDDVKVRPTRINMDGTTGEYAIVGAEDAKPVNELTAVILDKLDNSQVLFPGLNEAGQQIWPEEGGTWPKFICRADSVHGVPHLHPELTEEQRGIAARLRVNGALGANCTTCVHAQFIGGEKPRCAAARNLLVFDSLTREPALLQVKGTSIKHADRHLADYKKKKRALYADTITLGSKPEVDGMRKWKVMTFTRGDEAGTDAAGMFREIRRTMAPLLLEEMRSGRNVMLGTDDELVADHVPEPSAPVGETLPPLEDLHDAMAGLDDVPF